MSSKRQFHPGKLEKLWPFLEKLHMQSPEVFRTADLLRREVENAWPALRDKQHCPNCAESMEQYAYHLSVLDVQLVNRMADEVQSRIRKGMDFTEANQVHTPTLATSHTVRNRITYSSKLGLIAKYLGEKGTQVPGTWVITRRGFDALRDEPVPESVSVFRNEIIDRPEATTTFSTVVSAYNTSSPEDRYDGHDLSRWVDVIGLASGHLL